MKERRRRKFVPGGLQIKFILTTFIVAGLVLLFNLQYSLMGLWKIDQQPAATVEGILEQTKNMLLNQFLLIGAATVLLSLWAGLAYFNVCGPIYRFKQYFIDLTKGRWDVECGLRNKDQLVDLKDAINGALGLIVGKVQTQHKILQEAREVLHNSSSASTDAAKQEELIARIDEEAAEYSRRFGGDAGGAVSHQPSEVTRDAQCSVS